MPVNIQGMRSDPLFRAMSYEEQQSNMTEAIYRNMLEDPEAQGYSQEQVTQMAQQAARTWAPVLREERSAELTDTDRLRFAQGNITTTDPNDESKYALWLGEQMRQGNNDAANKATQWVMNRRMIQSTLTGKVLAGGRDIWQRIKYADQEADIGFDSDTTEKLSGYLMDQMLEDRASALKTASEVLGFVGAGTELVLLNKLLVGTAATGGGLVTKKAFAAVAENAANMASGAGRTLYRYVVPASIEAIGSGSVDVLRNLPEIIHEGRLAGEASYFSKIASAFGEGVAFDMVAQTAGDVFRATLKPVAKIFFGKKMNMQTTGLTEDLSRAIGAVDEKRATELLNGILTGKLSKVQLEGLDTDTSAAILQTAANMKAMREGLPKRFDSNEYLQMHGKIYGYDVYQSGSEFAIDRSGKRLMTAGDRRAAFEWIQANPRMPLEAGDLANLPYRGEVGQVISRTVGELNLSNVSNDTLLGMTVAARNGATDGKTIKVAVQRLLERADPAAKEKIEKLGVSYLREDNFVARARNMQDYTAAHPNSIVLPKTMNSPQTRELVLQYLTVFGKSKSENFGDIAEQYFKRSALSSDGLKVAAAKLPNGTLLQTNDAYRLNYYTSNGKPHMVETKGIEATSREVNKALIENGLINETELSSQLMNEFGVNIKVDTSEFGTTRYVFRDKAGTTFAVGDSIESLFQQRPDLIPKLPERLGPELYVLADGKVELFRPVATGPYQELLTVMDNFHSEGGLQKTVSQIEGLPDVTGNVQIETIKVQRGGQQYAVRINDLGFRTEFQTINETKRFAKEQFNNWFGLQRVGAVKGYYIEAGPNGKILISELDGKGYQVAETFDDARKIIQNAPMTESGKTLVDASGSVDIDEALQNGAREAIEKSDAMSKMAKEIDANAPMQAVDDAAEAYSEPSIRQFIANLAAPAYSALERISKEQGFESVAVNVRRINVAHRMMSSQLLKTQRVIKAIGSPNGKMINRNEDSVLGLILGEGEANWAKAALGKGLKLTPVHVAQLHAMKTFYDKLSSIFGIDTWRYLTDYVPKIRKTIAQMEKDGNFSALNKTQLLNHSIGHGWQKIPVVNFFAKHARYDVFLDSVRNRTGLLEQAVYYSEQGYKEKFFGPMREQLKVWRDSLAKRGLQPDSLQRIDTYINQVLGTLDHDSMDRAVTTASARLTKLMGDGVRNMGAVFPKEFQEQFGKIADAIYTPDIPGKLSAMVTHATLGFRPFRAVSNLANAMNTFAVYGDDLTVGMREVNSDYIEKLIAKDIIQEKVFATSARGVADETAFSKLLQAGLNPQQQSEYVTRGWTAKAVEVAFNRAYSRLGRGVISWDAFVKESRLNIIDESGVKA